MATDDEDLTPLFNPAPSAMLVAVGETLAQECVRALEPIKTLRVGHGQAALQRMLSTHPLVVVVGASVDDGDAGAIRQHAGTFGAHVIHERDLERGDLARQLKSAAAIAMRARATQGM